MATIFWLTVVCLPFSFQQALIVTSHGPTDSFLINLRIVETFGNGERYSWDYLVMIAVISAGLHLLNINKESKFPTRLRFAISIIVALAYCVLTTGRTWFFLLLLFLLALAIISRRISVKRALLYFSTAGVFGFVVIALLLGKAGNTQDTLADNARDIWMSFRIYLLAPLPSFDFFVRHHHSLRLGDNLFRSVWALGSKLGFDTHPLPLVEEFVNVPDPSNVYTVYRPYFDDFGVMGAIAIPVVLGVLHGILYRRFRSGNRLYTFLFALSLYPLTMQFFQDQYFSLLSQWLQILLILVIYFRLTEPSLVAQSHVDLKLASDNSG